MGILRKNFPYPIRLLIMFFVGCALNIAGGLLGVSIGSLLFLDMVGTAYVAILAPLPLALLVAFTSNFLLAWIAPQLGLGLEYSGHFALVNCIGAVAWSTLPRARNGEWFSGLFSPTAPYHSVFHSIAALGLVVGVACATAATFIMAGGEMGYIAPNAANDFPIGTHPATSSLADLALLISQFADTDGRITLFWVHILMGVPDKVVVTAIACGLAYVFGMHPNIPAQIAKVQNSKPLPRNGTAKKIWQNHRTSRWLSIALLLIFMAIQWFSMENVPIDKSENFSIYRALILGVWVTLPLSILTLRPYHCVKIERSTRQASRYFHVEANPNFASAFEDVLKVMTLLFVGVLAGFSAQLAMDNVSSVELVKKLDGPLGVIVAITAIRYVCCFCLRYFAEFARAKRERLVGVNA